MRFDLRVILGIVACAASITSAASQPLSVTLENAVRSALKNNPELAAARHEVAQANAQLREAWGYALPSIDFSGRYSRALKKPVFFFPNIFDSSAAKRGDVTAIEIGSDNSFDFSFTVSQVLFNSAVFTGVGTANIYAKAADELLRSKTVGTVSMTRRAFYGVLLAKEVLNMLQANQKNAEETFRNASVLANQGLLSEYDKLRAEVGLANIKPEVIRAENNYALALNNLKIAMGIAVETELAIAGGLTFSPVDDGIVERADNTVLENNPSLKALRYQEDVTDAITAIERANYLPSLAAFGSYQWQAQKNNFHFSTRDFVASSIVGLSISMNVFNGFRTNARVEQAELDTRKVQEQITHTEMRLRTAAESVVRSLRAARQRIDAVERTVEQAQRGYRIAMTRFTSGSGTQLEVSDAQLALTTATTNKIHAIYDYLVAGSELDELLGRIPDYAHIDSTEN